MNAETLYDAITQVKDELVDQAAQVKPAKKQIRWRKFAAVAAAAALAVGAGGWAAARLGGMSASNPGPGSSSAGGSGSNGGSTFMSYAGPVFPLTALDGSEGLTAARDLTYDFSPWTPRWRSVEDMARDSIAHGESWTYEEALAHYKKLWPEGGYDQQSNYRYSNNLLVTDSYTLTNPTDVDRTVTLLYSFTGSLRSLSEELPELTADGAELDAGLSAGLYSNIGGGRSTLPSLTQPESWETYRELLSDGRYQAGALEGWPDLSSIPVTVYEVTDPWVDADARNPGFDYSNYNPTLHASMELDYNKTIVLSYGFNGGSNDRENGTMRRCFSVPRPPEAGSSVDPAFFEKERAQPHEIIVIGEPVDSFKLLGTYDGDPQSANYMEWGTEVKAGLRQYETDLESALRTAAERMYEGWRWEDTFDRPDFELYFGLLKDCLLDTRVLSHDLEDRYDLQSLEEMYFESFKRVFYLKAQVTIPAGGSVTVEAHLVKAPSYDFYCAHTENQGVYGYDMTTRLGTSLDFTGLTATAVNTGGIEIVRQNYGFDWENGVNTVILDPDGEHYYLEVRSAKAP